MNLRLRLLAASSLMFVAPAALAQEAPPIQAAERPTET